MSEAEAIIYLADVVKEAAHNFMILGVLFLFFKDMGGPK